MFILSTLCVCASSSWATPVYKFVFERDEALGLSQSFVVAIVARSTSWGFAAEQQ